MCPQSTISIAERFSVKVTYNGPTPISHPEWGPCWLWIAALNRHGYGSLWGPPGHTGPRGAHAVAWFLATGVWPCGVVCHTCDTPACVRNDEPGIYIVDGIECPRMGHLFLASRKLIARDALAKGRLRAPWSKSPRLAIRQTSCKRGHPLDDANVWITSQGNRRCQRCTRDYQRLRARVHHAIRRYGEASLLDQEALRNFLENDRPPC